MMITKKNVARISFWAGAVTTIWGAVLLFDKIQSESVDLFWVTNLFLAGGVLLLCSLLFVKHE